MMRLLLVFISFSLLLNLSAQTPEIQKADSLFINQKYTEAYYLYEELFKEGKYTDAMLLKMAFIQDGSENFPQALYYLHLYYKKTADRSVLAKISNIASSNDFLGYQQDDIDYLEIIFSEYKHSLLLLFLSLLLFSVAYYFIQSRRGQLSVIALGLVLFFAIVLIFVNNYTTEREAIIFKEDTLLRSGPSGAAEPLQFIGSGHKVRVINQTEVWSEIVWNGEQGFVRNAVLKII